ncbi:biopolymer transporter ExbD [Scytonema hofmannii PCC 7110]|uniref:Biopolymer transporter ExbD n=1 Tax=Scytonema hofmannii PCC 7110 TaxID=128403 RepID=A0A139X4V2_9CYAN|nr:biopolymer transporter ExbD [Scytonema hofmannii]KYC39673.1 biopolymer transporter ExbD [Scytonema hofmannii PCC 7110]
MKINLHSPVEEAQIQILPLIDVIFCILTFFILAALQFTRQQAINIDLPKAKTGTSAANVVSQVGREILPVTIDAVGQTYVEKQPINREQLRSTLEDYIKKNPQGVFVLNASRSATYNDVIEMLDLLRSVGGDRVSLGIIPSSSGQFTDPSLPTSPSFPNNPNAPGGAPLPNTIPPDLFNPPPAPNQISPGQGSTPVNPSGNSPSLPQAPTGGKPNSAPNR